jgi:hypothetical protein
MSGFLNIFFLLANFELTKIANIANISQGGRTWRCSQRGSGEDAAKAGALGRTGALEVGDIPVVAGDQVEALGWTARDLFGLDKPAEKPHPSTLALNG